MEPTGGPREPIKQPEQPHEVSKTLSKEMITTTNKSKEVADALFQADIADTALVAPKYALATNMIANTVSAINSYVQQQKA